MIDEKRLLRLGYSAILGWITVFFLGCTPEFEKPNPEIEIDPVFACQISDKVEQGVPAKQA